MKHSVMLVALTLAAGCDPSGTPSAAKPGAPPSGPTPAAASGQLAELAKTNASVIGYLYSAETPYIVATFEQGTLVWRNQGGANRVAQGQLAAINDSDRTCIGFKQKNPTMPTYGTERYLVCEATASIKHSNSLPRSQDFSLAAGTLFLQYDPPSGTGFSQLFYAQRAK